MMDNQEIAAVLFNISTLLAEQQGNPYRIRAYRRAARNVLRAQHSLAERARAGEPLGIPFLGKRLTTKITQMARDGRCDFYDELCGDLPTSEQALLRVPGIGPKLAGRVARELATPEADEILRIAAYRGLQRVWGIGPKRAAAILASVTKDQPKTENTPAIVRDGNVIWVQESLWGNGHKQAA